MEAKIEDISYDGAGVAHLDGKVLFVPKTLPDEHVLVEIVQERASFSVGKAVKILQKSPLRVDAPCPYFEICGGCDFQHCKYETELAFKTKMLRGELKKCGYDGDVTITASPKRFFYRNKISFKCKDGKLGFFEAKSHKFFEAKKCLLADEKILGSLPIVQEFLQENSLENLTEVTFKTVDSEVAIIFLFEQKMLKKFEKIKKNAKNLQKLSNFFVFFAFGDVLESDKTKIFQLENSSKKVDALQRNFGSFSAKIDVSAFEQVNSEVATLLTDFMLSKIDNQNVVNAYSGQGVLTRLLSERANFVWGIELQKSAHESAEKLCSNLKNVKNLCEKVENLLPKMAKTEKIDAILLDPPRAGCQKEVLLALADVEKIVYCSCNPATLVRDLKILSSTHEIVDVHAFDMFACTANLETVVVLTKKG